MPLLVAASTLGLQKRHYTLALHYNNSNTYADVYGAVVMTNAIAGFTHFIDECRKPAYCYAFVLCCVFLLTCLSHSVVGMALLHCHKWFSQLSFHLFFQLTTGLCSNPNA